MCCYRQNYFCLLHVNCIEDAENVCILLKKIKNNQFPVKSHIHSKSSKQRTFKKKNFFYKLFKENENKKMNSEGCFN